MNLFVFTDLSKVRMKSDTSKENGQSKNVVILIKLQTLSWIKKYGILQTDGIKLHSFKTNIE